MTPLLTALNIHLFFCLGGLFKISSNQRVSAFTDEKERFDPTQFQESIVQGLNQTGSDLDAVAKFLDASGAKLDYRRYAETLFDILVAGGMLGESLCGDQHVVLVFYVFKPKYLCHPLAPGGTLSDDMTRTEFCLFTAQEDLETMQAYAQVNSSKLRRSFGATPK